MIELEAKLLGQDTRKRVKAGTKCHVDRNNGNPGEFLIWFGLKFYARVNAIDMPKTIFLLETDVL